MAYFLQNRRVSFLALRAFTALMRHRDTSRAAQELGILPQRLHYQLRSLETAIGKPLFRTGSPHWLPTPAALKLLPKVRGMLAIWEGLFDEPPQPNEPEPLDIYLERKDCPPGIAFWLRHSTM
ncbi:helix-turn-helix domain-containing protein [Cupriavidus sp. IDO]|uniref:helix-turn-helix domain-containing protein n=1 Tax=Cupriavidus sp. IDO TaxID=1539142 RepID=UPI0005792EEF|nr:LysR family transcriptional regulator [Cupriavidus sp. IDO]KWR81303.1 hypothetical protein RM96_29220 [Cupriavidus sp. IDO]